jgi:putative membrane protein
MSFPRDISASHLARCIAFLSLSFFISWLAQGGRLAKLVHPRMNLWIEAAGALFLVLAFVQMLFLARKPRQPDPIGFYVPIAFVIAIVFIFTTSSALIGSTSPVNFDSLAVQNAIISKRDKAEREASTGPLPAVLSFDDDHYWSLYNRLYDDPEAAAGHRVVIQGYFHRQQDYPAATGLVARNLMWCCSADMSQIGLLAQGEVTGAFGEKDWVEVTGRLSTLTFDFDGDGTASTIPIIIVDSARRVDKGYTSGIIFPF